MSAELLARLLAAVGAASALPGARCRGRAHLFDAAHPGEDATGRHTQALGLCRTCPALDRCTEWVTSLPAHRQPTGVIAGRIHTPKQRRNRTGGNRMTQPTESPRGVGGSQSLARNRPDPAVSGQDFSPATFAGHVAVPDLRKRRIFGGGRR